jgi:hypothetical protein
MEPPISNGETERPSDVAPSDDRGELIRRCYSLYLWAYTMAVSGGAVNYDVEGAEKEFGWDVVFAHQWSVAAGAARGESALPPWPLARLWGELEKLAEGPDE